MKSLFQTSRFALFSSCMLLSYMAFAKSPADFSWNKEKPQNVTSQNWTKSDISTFIESTTASDGDVGISSFIFDDLNGDGKLSLLASVDYSGREFFNNLILIKYREKKYSVENLSVHNATDVTAIIFDIKNDGSKELLLPTALTPYLGGPIPQATYIKILGWNGSIYSNKSFEFSEYYRQAILPNLSAKLVQANQGSSPIEVAKAQIEFDKASRLAEYRTLEVGLQYATELASNAEPKLRIWAAYVLADIGSEQAHAKLKLLTQDSNPEVARHSKSIEERSLNSKCEQASISVSSKINIESNQPFPVSVEIANNSSLSKQEIVKDSVRFGASGFEQGLVACNNGNSNGITCLFRSRNTALEPFSGVGYFRASLDNGGCLEGKAAVTVVGNW